MTSQPEIGDYMTLNTHHLVSDDFGGLGDDESAHTIFRTGRQTPNVVTDNDKSFT